MKKTAIGILAFWLAAAGLRPAPGGDDTRIDRALECMDLMLYEEAAAYFEQVLRDHPTQAGIRVHLGFAYFKLKQEGKAIDALTLETTAHPDDLKPLILLSYVRFLSGSNDEAETAARVYKNALDKRRRTLSPRLRNALLKDLFPNAGLPAYVLGLQAKSRQDTEAAQAFFAEAQSLSYAPADCWLQSIDTEIGQGHWDEASRLWDAEGDLSYAWSTRPQGRNEREAPSLRKPPGFMAPTAPARAGRALSSTAQPTKKRPLEGIPGEAWTLRAIILEHRGDRTGALSSLDRASSLRPFDGETWRNLGIALLNRRDFGGAARALSKGLKLNPLDVRSRLLLEQAQSERWIPDATLGPPYARDSLAGGRVRFRYLFKGNPKVAAETINRYALDLIQAGNLGGAAGILRSFSEIYEDSPTLYYNLGQIDNVLGRLAEGLECAVKAVALKRDYRDAIDLAGNITFKIRDFDRSLEFYRQAASLDDRDPMAFYNLGCVYRESGDAAEAEKAWLKAIALENFRPEAAARREAKPGEVDFSVKVRVEPISSPAYQGLGSLCAERGETNKALEYFEKAASFNPGAPEPHLEMGKLYLGMNKPDAARESFKKYLALGGDKAKVEAALKGQREALNSP